MRACPDVILPFPGGIARSGSKVGSKYKALRASTNTAYRPDAPRPGRDVELPDEVRCVYEIVIDGLTLEAVERAMAVGLRAACEYDTGAGLRRELRRQARAVPHPAATTILEAVLRRGP